MPPRSRATALDALAPDQRAAVELVLRQGRSYGELADLLGMPEETIRTRARSGLAGLAPDLPAPARAGEIADWLLGQQAEAHAARTRALVMSDPAAQKWASTVAEPLRAAPGGDALPPLPTGDRGANGRVALEKGAVGGGEAANKAGGAAAASRTGGDDAASASARAGEPAGADGSASRGRSSRLGGAILLGAAVVLVGLVLAFVLTRGDDDPEPAAQTEATATATPAAGANDIVLKGPAGSNAVGLMRLFEANDGTVRFAVAAQGVTPNASGQTYSLWFRGEDGSAQLLGDVKDPVAKNGELTSAGPGNDDVDEFPQWFTQYNTILVTLDEEGAKEPGKVILSGDLPNAG